jgi:hypothetical protein
VSCLPLTEGKDKSKLRVESVDYKLEHLKITTISVIISQLINNITSIDFVKTNLKYNTQMNVNKKIGKTEKN